MADVMTESKIKTGMDLRDARLSLGLNMAEFGRALGMSGTPEERQPHGRPL